MSELRFIKGVGYMGNVRFIKDERGFVEIKFGNPSRRKRHVIVNNILKKIYHNNKVYQIGCTQVYNSKTLEYFVDIIDFSKNTSKIIHADTLGKKHLNLKDCKDFVKENIKLQTRD